MLGGCVKQVSKNFPVPPKAPAQDTAEPKKTGNPYQIAGKWYYPLQSASGYDQTGVASWYGPDFHGKLTANGERYDMHAMSAAHTTLPLPTMVRVTNLENGRQIIVRVNDRGPFVKSRIIDLSYAAANALAYDKQGTARVRVQALEGSDSQAVAANTAAPVQAADPVITTPPVRASAPVQVTTGSTTTSSNMGRIYIQVGAFSSYINAKNMQERIRNDFANAHIQPPAAGMPAWYRVQIGPFDDVGTVENTVIELERLGHKGSVVIIR
ncbi:MAG: septal ring lytic transglycosylase RlpA family protein [Zetaproteobacteria bacterium CG_4_9_14_3_um_filter_49_83]|nr:MAG: septal ring lytic transglycosylase RlpA family lipoprotein [Zetaproteobacteria bacterium CG17_big_fil_post_rev_8_21_14_2_50_50_13]PIV29768.1 MAG: septal ring lytic transglycosylase RlpA family protein [Zetaproteobacteria bacterium CG02_land_8_20_14_3_00_50_9]PIY57233.1 MAG: septal ring lytic transglycosylase RlpA family protein [Zetaproteobacteria bacterium CG_4_10_14_0_8_um_filter_49_80]PJA35444.1 MAG: septal ring lytic transglycosylase RlpA family protein [Zetaproteobacteria bacterium 